MWSPHQIGARRLLGGFAAALGDTVLVSAVVLALVAAPVLAVRAVIAAASFILETPGQSS